MIQEVIEMLGRKAEDKVTGFTGAIATVSFDLYGCVQIWLTPPLDKDGKKVDGAWFDVNRLSLKDERVMPVPSFQNSGQPAAQYEKGPSEKSAPRG